MTIKLINFHADWCGPCEAQDSIVDKVAEDWKNNDNLEIEMVDIEEQQNLKEKYDVNTIPTIIISIESKDEIYERFIGITDKSKIEEAISNGVESVRD